MTLEVFQVRVLLVMAKRLNCIKIKRDWTMSGDLLRQAISSGFHREPSIMAESMSAFDQEMRRRLWYTIVEIDLDASLNRGMAATIGHADWDTFPPSNLHDEDFDETTEALPPGRSITDFTRSSYLCVAQQHLPLRLEIMSRINSIRFNLENEGAIELDHKIRQMLDGLPKWSDKNAAAMARPLSELLLYEYLVLVHQPFVTELDAQAQHFYSRMSRRSASLATMKAFIDMRLSTRMTLCNFRGDLFRACLATCHDLAFAGSPLDELMQDQSSSVRLVEQSVDIMEARIKCLGQGFHAYWLMCSALGLLRSKLADSPSIDESAQAIAERVSRLLEHIMSQQLLPVSNGMIPDNATMATADTLVGMSNQGATGMTMQGMDFAASGGDPFSAFADTLFDFDVTDLWNIGAQAAY
jgi:hypothetical protein